MSQRKAFDNQDVTLIDILDVVLDKGVVIKGDLILTIAGIDLVYIDLRVLIASAETLIQSNQATAGDLTSKDFDTEKEALHRVINEF